MDPEKFRKRRARFSEYTPVVKLEVALEKEAG